MNLLIVENSQMHQISEFEKRLQNWIIVICLLFGVYSIKLLFFAENDRFSALKPEPNNYWPQGDAIKLCSKEGSYDLTIPVQLLQSSKPKPTYLEKRLLKLSSITANVSQNTSMLKRWYDLEEKHKRIRYEYYPLAIDLEPYIENISIGLPTDRVPIYRQTIKLLRVSSSICAPTKTPQWNIKLHYDLVVVCKSSVGHFEQRNRLRAQLLTTQVRKGFKTGLVFLVGMPPADDVNFFELEGFNASLREGRRLPSNQSAWSADAVLRRLTKEADLHDDIIIGDFIDSYFNLTLKAIMGRLWATVFCRNRAHIFLFLDDDVHFSLRDVAAYLMSIPLEDQEFLMSGVVYQHAKVFRPKVSTQNRWVATENEIPWSRYPVFVSGRFYIMGYKLLPLLDIASLYTKPFHLEDVYLGFLLKKLKITIRNLPKSLNFSNFEE